jgi:tRNA pseudouridine(55) synthase
MQKFVVLDKKIGETPLARLATWQKEHPEFRDTPLSYAGRLDPMASGKLLVLIGNECKRQAVYTKLDKEYEVEVLLDIASDTGDVLGLPTYANAISNPKARVITRALQLELGTHERAYPIFSSKTVKGRPLFRYALEGTLSSIEVPLHLEQVYAIKYLETYKIQKNALSERISKLLDQVPRTDEPSKKLGEDFRVDAVRAEWGALFTKLPPREFQVIKIVVTCASGAYMRTLAGRIGGSLGTKALAFSITRTTIGKYLRLPLGLSFWIQRH